MKERRHSLAKRFEKKALKLDEMKDVFKPTNNKQHEMRHTNNIDVKFAAKSRLYNSSVPTLQRMINAEKKNNSGSQRPAKYLSLVFASASIYHVFLS